MNEPTTGGWTIDSAELREAASSIGCGLPISVLFDPEQATSFYSGIKDGQHQITINGGLRPGVASWTLLHEVAHASQCERMGHVEYAAYTDAAKLRAGGVHGDGVHEVEANALADWLHRRYQPAVKVVQS